MMKCNGEIRKMRKQIIDRADQIKNISPYDNESAAYVRGLEYALAAIDRQIE